MQKPTYILFIVIFICTVASPRISHATGIPVVDGAHIGTSLANFVGEGLRKSIWDAAEEAAKIAAFEAAFLATDKLLSGDGNPLFIQNPSQHIFENTNNEAIKYMEEEFFATTLKGRGSSNNYESISNDGSLYSSYEQELENLAKAAIGINQQKPASVDRSEYCSSKDTFRDGNFRCLGAMAANPLNSPLGYKLEAQQAYGVKLEQLQELAKIEAEQGDGYLPIKNEDGTIITPGSTIQDLATSIKVEAPINALVNASNPIVAGAMAAILTESLGRIKIGSVGANEGNQREVDLGDAFAGEVESLDPASRFDGDFYSDNNQSEGNNI